MATVRQNFKEIFKVLSKVFLKISFYCLHPLQLTSEEYFIYNHFGAYSVYACILPGIEIPGHHKVKVMRTWVELAFKDSEHWHT